ncbi:MAG: hypothetical protein OXJ56_10050 [Rhodospirillaceae bacterium]|nr:hypothetical protein [Rhodospirillaceae bacterium]
MIVVMLSILAYVASAWGQDGTTYPFQVENGMQTDITVQCGDGNNSTELNPGNESDFDCTVNTIRITHESLGSREFEYGEDYDLTTECQNGDGSKRVFAIWVVDLSIYNTETLQTTASIAFHYGCQ